ncbi:unnamed protein product [Symbiodinium natans]|uniref:Uncharacterized protein n=1 Tax=Symbiodinium natans TaxID=878477 RepID=A0A812IJF4_9DINO|nr:unnamed protein product [Symbiodinium natans]
MAHAVPAAKTSLVVTLSTCQHPESAHAFAVPVDDVVGVAVAVQTLQKASAKLGFRSEDVVDITRSSMRDWTAQTRPSCHPFPSAGERCCCGAVTAVDDSGGPGFDQGHVAALMQELFHDALREARLRPQATGVLHVLPRAERPTLPVMESRLPSEALPTAVRHSEPQQSLDKHELQLRKKSPRSLRQDAQNLWTALEKSKVYIPPVPDAPASHDRFHLERHGHGRGNTKSTKKRRKREDRASLCRLILHLEQLALEHGVCVTHTQRPSGEAHGAESTSDSASEGI